MSRISTALLARRQSRMWREESTGHCKKPANVLVRWPMSSKKDQKQLVDPDWLMAPWNRPELTTWLKWTQSIFDFVTYLAIAVKGFGTRRWRLRRFHRRWSPNRRLHRRHRCSHAPTLTVEQKASRYLFIYLFIYSFIYYHHFQLIGFESTSTPKIGPKVRSYPEPLHLRCSGNLTKPRSSIARLLLIRLRKLKSRVGLRWHIKIEA